jgi:hypothetical protein
MSTAQVIRTKVETFLQIHAIAGLTREDAFAPWFMAQHFRLPPQECLAQSSDRNYDGGIDAYYIETRKDTEPLLWIVQAKFSDQDAFVRKGIDDLRRAAETIGQILTVGPTNMVDEHRVLRNLRKDLIKLSQQERANLEVRFLLIHLLKDQELWLTRPAVQKAREEFLRNVSEGPLAGRASLIYRGPEDMSDGDIVPPLASQLTIRFDGVISNGVATDRALFGLGYLTDLVDLHDKYRADLFGKNVRMYLAREAAKPKSAASHIEKSLHLICEGRLPVLDFAMTHNGVTLSVPRIGDPKNGEVIIEPGIEGVYVLNGCQTVYTAWKFFKHKQSKQPDGTWRDLWNRIQLPMRIIVTRDDTKIRAVTIGANRQTEIRPSAFWAHDPIQIDLVTRFERHNVFYERQQGAWDELSRSDPAKAADFISGVVRIETLARVIAAADRTVSLDFAKSPNRIFDEESAYRRVFKERNLVSVRLLLFLVNTYEATQLALRDLANGYDKFAELRSSRFIFPVFRLLVHWIAKNDRSGISEFANALVSTSPSSEIRQRVLRWLSHHHSGIQQVLTGVWLDDDGWAEKEANDKSRLDRAFNKININNVFVFERWDDFDDVDQGTFR